MVTRDEVSDVALMAFLAERPRLHSEISALTEETSCGSTLDEYQVIYLYEELTKEAERHALSAWDYQLRLAEICGLDVSTLREEDRQAEIDALGSDTLL